MWSTELRRALRRADLRASLWIGSALLLFFAAAGFWYAAYTAMESLEEADRWFDFVLQGVVRDIDERGIESVATEDVRGLLPSANAGLRVRDASGAVLFERGDWPAPERAIPAILFGEAEQDRDLGAIWQMRRDNWMVGERTGERGQRVEIALPLAHFASEQLEIERLLLTGGLVAAGIAYLLGLIVTMRAFAPLRRATAQLVQVNPHRLGLRLPSRGTGDPIDVHAETLNRVLQEVDAGFARLRAFSSDAAHELRTPLNRIATVTEVALLQGGERELRSALESVEGTVEELSRVVQSLLLLSEIDERHVSPRRDRIDVPRWLEQHAAAYTAPFEEAGVELSVHSDDVAISGDRTLLDRVLANLLDNALDHAPTGTRVEVSASRRGDGVSITVDDAGPGIAEVDRDRVFDRFARLDDSTRPGHGLGLALARAIASLHGGSLRADTSPAGGARFALWLPAAATRAAMPSPPG
jgi:signal transduction histidine kinase